MGSQYQLLSDPYLGYLALAVCILTKASIDQGFERVAPDPDGDKNSTFQNEVEDMIKLRREQGLTYQEVAEIFGVSADAVFNRIRRYKKRI